MSIFVVFFGAIGFGLLLILLLAVSAPAPAKVDLKKESGGSPLVELDSEALGKLVAALLDKMGLELDRWQGGKNEILEIWAINPTPITGGKILVHCIPAPPETGKVDGRMIGKFVRAVRTAYVSKGLLFTTGTFLPDAHLEAEDAPIEIFDRLKLEKLIDQYFGDDDAESIAASAPEVKQAKVEDTNAAPQ